MAAYQGGSETAFSELFDRHAGSVHGFLSRRLGDSAAADDAFQEVFLRVHRARGTYDPARPFRAWLFGIAHNLVTDVLRRRGRAPIAVPDDDVVVAAARLDGPGSASPEALAGIREDCAALQRALGTLSADEATVLLLARVEGLPYDEIGTVLGRSAAATKQLAWRALRRIRLLMQRPAEEPR